MTKYSAFYSEMALLSPYTVFGRKLLSTYVAKHSDVGANIICHWPWGNLSTLHAGMVNLNDI